MMWTSLLNAVLAVSLYSFRGAVAQSDCQRIDLCFIVDGSGSICDADPTKTNGPDGVTCDNWNLTVAFVNNFIGDLDIGDDGVHVGLVLFANNARLLFDLAECSASKEDAQRCVSQTLKYPGGNTATAEGINVTRESCFRGDGDRPSVSDVAVILTDGNASRPAPIALAKEEASRAAQLAINEGVIMFALGVTSAIDINLLAKLSSPPRLEERNYFKAANFSELEKIRSQVVEETCEIDCRVAADVCIMVDSSGSIRPQHFALMKTFVQDILLRVAFNDTASPTRVAVVQFSNDAELLCELGDVNCYKLVGGAHHHRGGTHTAAGLEMCLDLVFNGTDRADARNVGILIADGGSNDKQLTYRTATKARKEMEIFTVGIGWADEFELKAIASDYSDDHYSYVERFSDLLTLVEPMNHAICNTEDGCAGNPCRNGGTCVNRAGKPLCNCPIPFGGETCEFLCSAPPDLVFSIDAASGMGRDKFVELLDFAKSVAKCLPLGNGAAGGQVAMMTFSNQARDIFDFDEYDSLIGVLDGLSSPYYHGGSTDMSLALSFDRDVMFRTEKGMRLDRSNVTLLITDGKSLDRLATWQEASLNREASIQTVVVGLTGSTNQLELEMVAGSPNNVFYSPSFSGLGDMVDDVCAAVCNVADSCDPNPCINGGQCTDFIAGYHCYCGTGFSGINCERATSGLMDIAIVLDRSGSIPHERFGSVLDFLVALLQNYNVWSGEARVSVVAFSDNAEVIFNFDSFSSFADVALAIKRIQWTSGRTNIANALRVTREQVFTAASGDRADVPNFVWLFSDGGANNEISSTVGEAISLKQVPARITAMSIGTHINVFEMENIVSRPITENMLSVTSFSFMMNLIPRVVGSSYNSVDNCEGVTCQNNGNCVDLYGVYTCENCDLLFTEPDCSRKCNRSMDISLIMDVSGSHTHVCEVGMEVLREIVLGVEIRDDTTRVSLIEFSSESSVVFLLNSYTTRDNIMLSLVCKGYGGFTNSQAALEQSLNDVFTSQGGDRQGVDNVVVLVTDGKSNIRPENTIPSADRLKTPSGNYEGAEVYVVALEDGANLAEVNAIASQPTSRYVRTVTGLADAKEAASGVLDELCN